MLTPPLFIHSAWYLSIHAGLHLLSPSNPSILHILSLPNATTFTSPLSLCIATLRSVPPSVDAPSLCPAAKCHPSFSLCFHSCLPLSWFCLPPSRTFSCLPRKLFVSFLSQPSSALSCASFTILFKLSSFPYTSHTTPLSCFVTTSQMPVFFLQLSASLPHTTIHFLF